MEIRKKFLITGLVIPAILLLVIILPAIASSSPGSENATWTTYGDFSGNASTSGYKSVPSQVKISGSLPADDASVTLAGISRDSIAAGGYHSLGIKNDGTVVAAGSNSDGQLNVSSWSNIRAIAAGLYHSLGVKNDGHVAAIGKNNYHQIDVSSWSNIIDVAGGDKHSLGLKSDGTVIGAGNNTRGQINVSSWTNVKDVSAGSLHSIGLKGDGTVVSAGIYQYTDGTTHDPDVSSWSGVVAVSASGSNTVGLKSDGTVIATGLNDKGQTNVAGWSSIVAVAAGGNHTVGLKRDGTVIAAGDNTYNQSNVSTWTGIVAISAGVNHTMGLKADGTMMVAGTNNNAVATWTDIKQPGSSYFSSGTLSGLIVGSDTLSDWTDISWNGSTPAGTTLKFRTRGAGSKDDLAAATWSDYYLTSGSSITTDASNWLEIEATLATSDSTASPSLDDVTVSTQQTADTVAPVVTDVQPSGTIDSDSATVAVYYNDPSPSSGIDTAAVAVYLDSNKLDNCDVTVSSASCDVYGIGSGEHQISGSVADNAGNTTEFAGYSFIANTPNHSPVITVENSSISQYEGAAIANYGAWSDIDPGDDVSLSASRGTITKSGSNLSGVWQWSDSAVDGPSGDAVTITAFDGTDNSSASFDMYVYNSPPSVGAISKTSPDLISMLLGLLSGNLNLGGISTTANFTDPGILDTHTAVWDWGDGTTSTGTVNETNGSGTVSGVHAYSLPGSYTVKVTVTDKDGGSGTSTLNHTSLLTLGNSRIRK